GLGMNYLMATGLAVEAAVVHNFLWHERFTWAERRTIGVGKRFLKFSLSNGCISLAGNTVLMALLVSLKVSYLVANAIVIGACSLFNFIVSDRLVFRCSA